MRVFFAIGQATSLLRAVRLPVAPDHRGRFEVYPESGLNLKPYAEKAGKNEKTLHTKLRAWRVLANLHVEISQIREVWRNLSEIHAAP